MTTTEPTPAADASPPPSPPPAAPKPADPPPAPDPGKTFTQADLDRIVGERVDRERRKFAGYGELKSKAAQFDELAEAQKTEHEKLADRADAAEKRATAAEAALLRRTVAERKGLPAELAERLAGSTEEELGADADALIALLPSPGAPKPPSASPKPDPSQGAKPPAGKRPRSLTEAVSNALRPPAR
jgi:Domain of unknown function (DUF4355)